MKTKFFVIAFLMVSILGTACLKTEQVKPCVPVSVADEKTVMQKYATDNGYTMITETSGLMYEILSQGTGLPIASSSSIKMKYIGKKMDGVKFDEGSTTQFATVNQFITGFQLGLMKLNGGGKIRLIMPSSLAYGCSPYVLELRNQPLFFEVEVLEVQ